ncbi:alpha/beta hydrolase family protein [Bacteroides sp.]
MKRGFLLTSLLLITLFISAQDITGTWKGKLSLPMGQLNLVFNISRNGELYKATCDSPDQGVNGIPTESATFTGSVLTIQIPAISASYKGEMKEDGKIHGTFTQGLPFPLVLEKGEIEKPKRPQEPQPPFPYKTEEVTFRNEEADITLAGTLSLPQQGSKSPAVVLITGSGPQNRDEELAGHKPFLVIADYLTRHGIAVLRFDDRGTAQSGGNFQTSTSIDFATDAAAALKYLRSRKEINPKKTGLLGHSEGGLIAIMQAAKDKNLSFIVSLAGPGVKGDSLMLKQAETIFKSQGMAEAAWLSLKPSLRERYAILTQDKSAEQIKAEFHENVMKTIPPGTTVDNSLRQRMENEINAMTSPWYIQFMKYDPTAALQKIKCPVFALNGEKDIQVDAAMNLKAIEENILSNGNKKVTTKMYPELNHLFQHCKQCTLTEYGQLEETISPEVLKDVANWILNITK